MATTVMATTVTATTTGGVRSRVGRRRVSMTTTTTTTMRGVVFEGEVRHGRRTSTLGWQRVKRTTTTTTTTRAMEKDESSPSSNEMSQQRFDARTFDAKIEDLANLGLTRALREVDARLERAMRGEAASTSTTNDADGGDKVRMDGEMAEREAVDLMACLRQRGEIKAFGAAHNVPKRDYALAELRLNGIEAEKLLAPTESTIKGIRDNFTRVFGLAYVAGLYFLHPTFAQGAGTAAFAAFCATYDQVAFGGGVSALAFDTVAQSTSKEYVTRLRRHEAAHFLTAYLIGILPKGYTLSSLDAFKTYGALNIQAGCAFCDGEFQREVQKGKITSTSLGRFACVAMAGICMEYILFGFAEGGLSDVQQLDGLLRALAFSQKKSDSEVRWAVLNTTALLRRHVGVTEKLADAMARGASVGECVTLIETEVQKAELV
jgi:hypothetical protein